MEFLKSYFLLLKIRFEKAVHININIPEESLDLFLIPPISLQILAENAIKHNEFSDSQPLVINIEQVDDELQICNSIRRKMLRKPSSKIGLQNLAERYKLTTSRDIKVDETEKQFLVKLPILKIS